MNDKKPFAKKSFGQNFLVDQNYIARIIDELNLAEGETIIEIGAGRGALTEKLIESGAEVIAIELEREMTAVLREEFGKFENFILIEGDALKVDFAEVCQKSKVRSPKSEVQSPKSEVQLVANLPYNISTAILQRLIAQREVFSEAVLMLQREVVERITAKAGNPERGFLSVLVEAFCQSEKLFDVPPEAFRPIPQVWSSVVRIKFREVQRLTSSEENDKLLWQIVSCGFAQKRKTILNNLKNAPPKLLALFELSGGVSQLLENAQINFQRRAETLTVEEWTRLADSVSS